MIHDTIKRIENEIEANITGTEQKNELLNLIDNLKVEIESLKEGYHEDARSITKFTENSVIEATREFRDEELLSNALLGMQLSVRRFEVSHPKLIGIINSIGKTLSDVGV